MPAAPFEFSCWIPEVGCQIPWNSLIAPRVETQKVKHWRFDVHPTPEDLDEHVDKRTSWDNTGQPYVLVLATLLRTSKQQESFTKSRDNGDFLGGKKDATRGSWPYY